MIIMKETKAKQKSIYFKTAGEEIAIKEFQKLYRAAAKAGTLESLGQQPISTVLTLANIQKKAADMALEATGTGI